MTDTLKPAELDLEALKKVALEATPGPWSYGLTSLGDKIGADPDSDGWTVIAESPCPRSPYKSARAVQWRKDADHIAAANPATVLSLLTRIEALEAERDEARARLRNVPGLRPFNDAEDAAWPLAMARLQNTEPGPDQGIAMVGTDDLELALRRLSQFADVALRNAAVIGGLEARALSAEAQRDRMREALERLLPAAKLLQANSEGCAVNHYGEDFGLHGMPGFLIDTAKDIEAAAALSQGSGEEG